MVCNRSPVSPRRCAPINLTADVPAGQRPVRICKLPGRAFVCLRGALMNLVRLPCSCAGDPDCDTFLAPHRASRTGHDGSMEQARRERSSRMLGGHGALANKRAADAHAHGLVATIRNLLAAGFVSQRALADELNRKGIATARGGNWHRTTVARVLARLGLTTNGRINNGQAHKQAAEARAKALASTNSETRDSRLCLRQRHRARAERARDTSGI